MHGLVRAPLRRHHDTADLLDLRVVGGTHSVQEARDLGTKNGRNVYTHNSESRPLPFAFLV